MSEQDGGLRERIVDIVQDGAALIGAALITYGTDMVYRPAAFIVAGAFMFVGSWLFARTRG